MEQGRVQEVPGRLELGCATHAGCIPRDIPGVQGADRFTSAVAAQVLFLVNEPKRVRRAIGGVVVRTRRRTRGRTRRASSESCAREGEPRPRGACYRGPRGKSPVSWSSSAAGSRGASARDARRSSSVPKTKWRRECRSVGERASEPDSPPPRSGRQVASWKDAEGARALEVGVERGAQAGPLDASRAGGAESIVAE